MGFDPYNYSLKVWGSIRTQILEVEVDAFLSSLLDPLEGLSMLNCEKLELGATPDFQH
jgi:hypothetical protein